MKTLTVKLPERVAAEIEAESRERGISKSDVVRERLELAPKRKMPPSLAAIADLIGSVAEGPSDRSRRKKYYLEKLGYGRNRAG
ncbi:MAG TPA: CopG family transcriptional regulator [Rhizomicrobium sp.]|jgi:Arc/MetJ-type ribon-helix-helix transcriptional regulator